MLRPDEVREVPAKAAAGTVPGYRCAVLSNAAGIQVRRDRPEKANRIVCGTAIRWTKCKYAFFAAIHVGHPYSVPGNYEDV